MVDKFCCDASIIRMHPVLGKFADRLQCVADIIDKEGVVQPNTDERTYWLPGDTYANALLRRKGIVGLYGDSIMQRLSPGGKEVDIFMGVVVGAGLKRLLAVECKLKVGSGTCADVDFYRDLEAKFDQAKSVIKELPTAFCSKMIVLMCRRNALVCRQNLRRFQLQYRRLATFSCLECFSVEDFNGSFN